MTNIFAYTAPGSEYPGYVSINRTKDGDVSVTVRGEVDKSGEYPLPGAVAEFTIPESDWPFNP